MSAGLMVSVVVWGPRAERSRVQRPQECYLINRYLPEWTTAIQEKELTAQFKRGARILRIYFKIVKLFLPSGIWSIWNDTEKISMAPALRMTRSIKEKLPIFLLLFLTQKVSSTSQLSFWAFSEVFLLFLVVLVGDYLKFWRFEHARSSSSLNLAGRECQARAPQKSSL